MSYRVEGTDIVIDGFANGIAPDPYSGLADMRNMNISGTFNEASVNFATVNVNSGSFSGNTTIDATTDIVTFTGAESGNGLENGMAVVFTTMGTLNLTAGKAYFLLNVLGNTAKLALTYGGASIDITGAGTPTYVTINMALPMYGCTEYINTGGQFITTNQYLLDSNGRAWKFDNQLWYFLNNGTSDTNNLPTNSAGNGIEVWHGYLFVFRSNKIDVWSTSATNAWANWNIGWQTLNTPSSWNNSHQALVAYNDTLYWCDGSQLGSVFQLDPATPFDPATPSTYNYQSIALALPTNDTAICLGQSGQNLLVGGARNFIYPWDKIQQNNGTDTLTSFGNPIILPENIVTRMVTANNTTYVFAGNRGRIYQTNGTSASQVAKIPDFLTGTNNPYFFWKDAIFHRNKLFFSFSSTNNKGTTLTTLGGVWSLDLSETTNSLTSVATKPLCLENQLSYGTYAGYASVLLSLYSPTAGSDGEGFLAGWTATDSSSGPFGVDMPSSSAVSTGLPLVYNNYQAYLDTDMIPIGSFLSKKTFTNLEFKLSKPLITNEKIKIYFRTDLSQTFTASVSNQSGLIGETTTVGVFSDIYPMPFEKVQWVQFRVYTSSVNLTTNNAPSFVRLTELRIRKSE